jgi:hypothetical protein
MGLFKKQESEEEKILRESLAGFKEVVINNFDFVVFSGKRINSWEVAEAAGRAFMVGVETDDAELRKHALDMSRAIEKSINSDLTAVQRGKTLLTLTNNSLELRKRYASTRYESVADDISLIGQAFYGMLESSDDWDQVLDATVEHAKSLIE